eukprot:1934052-Prymnesium_polylepis.1
MRSGSGQRGIRWEHSRNCPPKIRTRKLRRPRTTTKMRKSAMTKGYRSGRRSRTRVRQRKQNNELVTVMTADLTPRPRPRSAIAEKGGAHAGLNICTLVKSKSSLPLGFTR